MAECIIDKYSKQELESILENCKSMTEFARKIGYANYSSSNQRKITEVFEKYGIQKIHGRDFNPSFGIKDDNEIFVKDSNVSQHCLRDHYTKLYPPINCSICGMQAEWQGKPLTLILDHINDDHFDDRLENLRWVCPNCNQQLDTTGYKKNSFRKDKEEILLS